MSHFAKQCFVVCGLSLSLWGCTEAIPEFKRLQPLDGVEFNGKTSLEMVIDNLGAPLLVKGECDRTASDVILSEDKGSTWDSCKSLLGNGFTMECKQKGEVSMTFSTDNSGILKFTQGVAKTYELKLKAKDGSASSDEAILKISYKPKSQAANSNYLIYSSGGVVTGSSHVLRYRMGTGVAAQTSGSVYQIKSSQE